MTVYQDYKYIMQDVGNLYLGAKFTYADLIENEEIPFKLKMLVEKHIKPDLDADTTLESHLYYMDTKGFIYQIFCQLKVKVKFNYIVQKKNLFGHQKEGFAMKTLKVEEFVKMSPAEKEKQGIVIQEVSMSKMALMTFSL
ncbi:MAG: hypothetical protein IJW63_09810 [Lachnospiraceae bacterium]|nr:hypothetical protein [Lachnospiraceae bacterium]